MVYDHSEKFRNSEIQNFRKSDGWGMGGVIKVNKVSAVSTALLSGIVYYQKCGVIIRFVTVCLLPNVVYC